MTERDLFIAALQLGPDRTPRLLRAGMSRMIRPCGSGSKDCWRPTNGPVARSERQASTVDFTLSGVESSPAGSGSRRHDHRRTLQAAGGDRRRRHGDGLGGRADRAGPPQGRL